MKKLSQKRKLDYVKQTLYFYENPNCEVCGVKVIDPPHHIIFRSQGGGTDDDNLISLCRLHHNQAHFKKRFYIKKEELWKRKGLDIEIMREKYKIARLGCKTK